MIDWQAIGTAASVVSAFCAVVAAGVAVAAWRKARSSDLTSKIEAGDSDVREEAKRGLMGMTEQVAEISEHIDALRESVARIETEQQHHLTARSLGPIHEKINGVDRNVAAVHAEVRAQGEQLRMISNYLMKNLP